jgi:hypothetical protein
MARTKRPATYISNVHPTGRVCGICRGPIITGQGAYVAQTGTAANHIACPAR